MKEYGCLQEMGLGAICSSVNNFLCEDCTEKLIRRVEELEDAQQNMRLTAGTMRRYGNVSVPKKFTLSLKRLLARRPVKQSVGRLSYNKCEVKKL